MRSDSMQTANRRPVGLRGRPLIRSMAAAMARAGIAPNHVSLASVVFAGAAGLLLAIATNLEPRFAIACLLAAPALIGLRGLCNLIDGLIAVEGGRRTKSGEVFNDVPDRASDLALFVGAGYGVLEAGGVELGWAAGALAIFVAYARMLGGALGTPQDFRGPCDKVGRMSLLALASLAAAVEFPLRGTTWSLWIGLALIVLGSLLTAARRIVRVVRTLESA